MFTTRHKLLAAILLAGASLSVQATEASFDGAEEPGNHVVFHAPGADEAGLFAPTGAANDYLFVAGSAFNARTSTQTVTYPGAGCINSTAAVTTDLQLPQGAEIQGIRTYYYDMASAGTEPTTPGTARPHRLEVPPGIATAVAQSPTAPATAQSG